METIINNNETMHRNDELRKRFNDIKSSLDGVRKDYITKVYLPHKSKLKKLWGISALYPTITTGGLGALNSLGLVYYSGNSIGLGGAAATSAFKAIGKMVGINSMKAGIVVTVATPVMAAFVVYGTITTGRKIYIFNKRRQIKRIHAYIKDLMIASYQLGQLNDDSIDNIQLSRMINKMVKMEKDCDNILNYKTIERTYKHILV